MFLPQKWKDSNVSRDTALINMDPNLTLAHLTHDCSMILLHQHIAYPRSGWNMVKLPSSCSAETCQLAAVEIANISHKYLKYTKSGLVNGQFAFCTFVAARALLSMSSFPSNLDISTNPQVNWRFCNTSLLPEFFSLVSSLNEMSRRWQGKSPIEPLETESITLDEDATDLAANYAQELLKLHSDAEQDRDFCSKVLGYENGKMYSKGFKGLSQLPSNMIRRQAAEASLQGEERPPTHSRNHSLTSQNGMTYGNPLSLQLPDDHAQEHSGQQMPYFPPGIATSSPTFPNGGPHNPMYRQPSMSHGYNNMGYAQNEDELTAISHTLLGTEFLGLDRVITLNDTDFSMNFAGWENFNGTDGFHG